jgi:hypothetical protein
LSEANGKANNLIFNAIPIGISITMIEHDDVFDHLLCCLFNYILLMPCADCAALVVLKDGRDS